MLDAAQRAGFEIPFSCRKGVCGTCKGRVVSGEVRAFAGDALGGAERAEGQVLFCNARPRSDLVIAPRSIAKADPFARKTVMARVFRLQRLADDVMLVHLRFPAGIRVKFKAGQHLNLILDNGERRDFSMANPPRESDGAQLHIRHVPGGAFTSYVFDKLQRGDTLKLEVPFGDFILQESSKPILFVAGSTGFAPIKAIIEDMFIAMSLQTLGYIGLRTKNLEDWTAYAEPVPRHAARRQEPRHRLVPHGRQEAAPRGPRGRRRRAGLLRLGGGGRRRARRLRRAISKATRFRSRAAPARSPRSARSAT